MISSISSISSGTINSLWKASEHIEIDGKGVPEKVCKIGKYKIVRN